MPRGIESAVERVLGSPLEVLQKSPYSRTTAAETHRAPNPLPSPSRADHLCKVGQRHVRGIGRRRAELLRDAADDVAQRRCAFPRKQLVERCGRRHRLIRPEL